MLSLPILIFPREQQTGASNPHLLSSKLSWSVVMEQIFYTQGKGRVLNKLTVFSDGQQYLLHFLILGRTNPTKAERAAGEKEKRFVVLEQKTYIKHYEPITPDQFPLPELVEKFVNFLKNGKNDDTDSN